ncbi:hypothetical protein LPJ56_005706, partial [Coemansia sp. RSA 2599]
MVKSVLVLGIALASLAANASAGSFHGYHHSHRKDVKPFGPSARSSAHHTIYSSPVQVQPLRFGKRNLRASRLNGSSGAEDPELEDAVSIAASYLSEHHDIPEDNMKLKSAYRSEHTGVTHVYFRQVVNGLEVVNGNANVNIDKNGRVISSGNSFSSSYTVSKPSSESEHTWTEAAEAAIKGSWETAHKLVSSAFDELVSEVTDGVDKVMEM